MKNFVISFLFVVCAVCTATADVFYCDPVNGSTPTTSKDVGKGDGTQEKPWGTFESVIKARLINGADRTKAKIHAGDTVKLLTGNHGKISFQSDEYKNTAEIIVEAGEGEAPVISQLSTKFSKNWTFRGITFQRPSDSTGPGFMLFRGIEVTDYNVEQCRFQSIEDATVWTDSDWETRCAQYGLWLSGTNITAVDNNFYAIENCVYVEGDQILVDNNRIEFFLNDGIEHCASNLKITRNRITDQYNLASNIFHHDGIQGWSLKGIHQKNIVIDSNFVARSTGKYKTIQPISSAVFQGISIFDGPFSKVTISNNVVMASASHAIALYGCTDSVIERNTVIYQGITPLKPCWIGVFVGKPKWGAVVPKNITVLRNIAPTYALTPTGVNLENNFSFKAPGKPYQTATTIVDPSKTFVKYVPETAVFDLTIRDDSPAAGKIVRIDGAGARQ
jgi:hypothetical protein